MFYDIYSHNSFSHPENLFKCVKYLKYIPKRSLKYFLTSTNLVLDY